MDRVTCSNKINNESVSLCTHPGLISSNDPNIDTNNHQFTSATTDNRVNLLVSQNEKNVEGHVEHSNFTTKAGKNDNVNMLSNKSRETRKSEQARAKKFQKPQNKNNYAKSDTTKNFVNIMIWNIHGLKKLKADLIENRTPESEFGKMFPENDIIFLCETWRDCYDQFDVIEWDDEFQEYLKNAYRNFKNSRSSGAHTYLSEKQ